MTGGGLSLTLIYCHRSYSSFLTLQIKSIRIHNLGPGSHEVAYKLLSIIILSIHFSIGAQDRVRTKHEISTGCGLLDLATAAITDFKAVICNGMPAIVHVGQIDEKVIRQLTFTVSENTVL